MSVAMTDDITNHTAGNITDDKFTISAGPRFRAAMILAIIADAVQIAVFPLFVEGALSPAEDVLDFGVGALMVNLLGWHWEFLPSFFAKLVPGVDMVPFWTMAVANVYRKSKRIADEAEETRPPRPVLDDPRHLRTNRFDRPFTLIADEVAIRSSAFCNLLQSSRHDDYGYGFGSCEHGCQRQGRWSQRGDKRRLQSGLPSDADDHQNHRAGVARPQYLRFGGWRGLGREVDRCVSPEILLRRVAAATRSDRASRGEARARALGNGTLGPRDRDADVRVWGDVEGSAGRDSERSDGRGPDCVRIVAG